MVLGERLLSEQRDEAIGSFCPHMIGPPLIGNIQSSSKEA
jgi:hypothetical protein